MLFRFRFRGWHFAHLVIEVPNEEYGHAQHEANSADAHDSIVGRKKVGKQFHLSLLEKTQSELCCRREHDKKQVDKAGAALSPSCLIWHKFFDVRLTP